MKIVYLKPGLEEYSPNPLRGNKFTCIFSYMIFLISHMTFLNNTCGYSI